MDTNVRITINTPEGEQINMSLKSAYHMYQKLGEMLWRIDTGAIICDVDLSSKDIANQIQVLIS